MKILTLHCDYIKFQALKKALKNIPDLSEKDKKEHEVKECLVVLTAIEKGDSDKELHDMLEAVKKTAGEVKTNSLVLYPYAHLSSNLSAPQHAIEMLDKAEQNLKKDNSNFKVTRAPFGYYKTFEFKCKGHPLSELSKSFGQKQDQSSVQIIRNEVYDEKKLLREISSSKLDTSKLKDNDHRILGQRLDLFSFNNVAPGCVFWHDNGLFIHNKLKEYIRGFLKKYNYQEITTPQILDSSKQAR